MENTEKTYLYINGQYAGPVAWEFEPATYETAPEETVTMELTLTDLKTIAYYMAEEEDADPTKLKIDEALKEML